MKTTCTFVGDSRLPVRVHVADQVESTVGVTTNVSRGGIRIVTSGPLHAPFAMGTDIVTGYRV